MKKARKRFPSATTTFKKVHATLVDLGMDSRAAYATFMVLLGYSDAEIAYYGDTSERSAKRWVSKALSVAGAQSRSQLWPIGLALAEQRGGCRRGSPRLEACRAAFAGTPNEARRWLYRSTLAAHRARERA